ncbi:GNAT family N-acetyltransferase [Flavobacterium sp. I-SCBP12n]|uniref:GNAT family N-acetyltransferase n=1 Tax=Flavobacterium pygoscelis TaxID=2893176 RepID=A0A9X1XQC8_9FLAO|nr:GNAT family N-acetyltransferase [Flavobacterium pygoscelis]MCK8141469.1 GNAT family N-acetyltransferase [Flavobacterium pygoscelis]
MLSFRKAEIEDLELYFDWANDNVVREQSFNSNKISLDKHKQWFESKLIDENCTFFLFENNKKEAVGQIRIQKENQNQALIGISIDKNHRGNGYAKKMLEMATDSFCNTNPDFLINAYIKESNLGSKRAFENAGFEFIGIIDYDNFRSFHYIKQSRK